MGVKWCPKLLTHCQTSIGSHRFNLLGNLEKFLYAKKFRHCSYDACLCSQNALRIVDLKCFWFAIEAHWLSRSRVVSSLCGGCNISSSARGTGGFPVWVISHIDVTLFGLKFCCVFEFGSHCALRFSLFFKAFFTFYFQFYGVPQVSHCNNWITRVKSKLLTSNTDCSHQKQVAPKFYDVYVF